MSRFVLIFILAIGQTSIACLRSETNAEKRVAPEISAVRTPSDQTAKIIRNEGWEIPGLKNSRLTRERTNFKSVNGRQIFSTVFTTAMDENAALDSDFFTDDERLTLHFFPQGMSIITRQVVALDAGGKPFCYIVEFSPRGVSAIITLFFYDNDGDGRFETVSAQSENETTKFPEWVKQSAR